MNRFLRLSIVVVATSAINHVYGQTPAAEPKTPPPAPAIIQARSLDLGRLDDGKYVNNFFGLSLSVPHDWVIVTAQRQKEIVEDTKKIAEAGGDAKQAKDMVASIERSTVLLSLTRLPAGLPGNAGFMLIAETVPSPSIRTGVEVLQSMERLAKGTNFKLEFLEAVHSESISGADFGVTRIRNTSPYGTIMQKIYTVVKNGYAIQFFYSYTDDADLAAFDSIVKSIKLK